MTQTQQWIYPTNKYCLCFDFSVPQSSIIIQTLLKTHQLAKLLHWVACSFIVCLFVYIYLIGTMHINYISENTPELQLQLNTTIQY